MGSVQGKLSPDSRLKEWREFERYLIYQNRFVLNRKWSNFVNEIVGACSSQVVNLNKDQSFYRARAHPLEKSGTRPEECLSWDELIPSSDKARAGRVNPEGIPVLYLSSDERTAIAESRVWQGAWVTVGEAKLIQNQSVVNLTIGESNFNEQLKKNSVSTNDQFVCLLDIVFKKPAFPEEPVVSYAASQYLAEVFKKEGYDGIAYRSSLNEEGYNLALFDPNRVQPGKRFLHKVISIKYETRSFKT